MNINPDVYLAPSYWWHRNWYAGIPVLFPGCPSVLVPDLYSVLRWLAASRVTTDTAWPGHCFLLSR